MVESNMTNLALAKSGSYKVLPRVTKTTLKRPSLTKYPWNQSQRSLSRRLRRIGVMSRRLRNANAIRDAAANRDRIDEMRRAAVATCDELFAEDRAMDRWSALYADVAGKREAPPVLIIGAGRSGTKYLRSMLAASDEIAAVPYDVGYVWRTGNEDLPHDEISKVGVSERDAAWMRKTLPTLAEKKASEMARILVEKSVPNSLRVAMLHRVFPNARFLHLVRDGRAVTESALRQWQEPADSGYLLKKLR